ncbi:hypothetical protein [Curtobacterium luteum]|uniref:hypothetical protein n=1 Tax=Curtobacterium luteum TaxID=33881 RepID=UPI0037F5D2E2
MEFSWWTWSGLMVIALVGLGLIGRAVVVAIRRDGIGRARAERGTSAPWFWSGVAVLTVAGLLLILWIIALDR